MTAHSHAASSHAPVTGTELITRYRSELDTIGVDDVITARVDIPDAAGRAVHAIPEIEGYRSALEERFGKHASKVLDRLEPLSRLLLATRALHASEIDADLEPSAQSLREMRDRLAAAADVLIARGLIDAKSLANLTGGSSYQALVVDSQILVSVFETHAASVASRSKVTQDELRLVYHASDAFFIAFNQRESARAGTSSSARDRANAFTLFFRSYDDVRKMLTYLRWHEGDADVIAPSVYVRERAAKRASSDTTAPTTPALEHSSVPGLPGSNPFHS